MRNDSFEIKCKSTSKLEKIEGAKPLKSTKISRLKNENGEFKNKIFYNRASSQNPTVFQILLHQPRPRQFSLSVSRFTFSRDIFSFCHGVLLPTPSFLDEIFSSLSIIWSQFFSLIILKLIRFNLTIPLF